MQFINESKAKRKLSKHGIVVLASLVIVLLLNALFIWFVFWPSYEAKNRSLESEDMIIKSIDRLEHQLQAIKESNAAKPAEEADEDMIELWDVTTWKSEFGMFLSRLEAEHRVLFTDMTYQSTSPKTEVIQMQSGTNITMVEDSFTLIMGGSLQHIANTIDAMYDMPAIFELVSWDLSPGELSFTANMSAEQQYVLRMQGQIKLIAQ